MALHAQVSVLFSRSPESAHCPIQTSTGSRVSASELFGIDALHQNLWRSGNCIHIHCQLIPRKWGRRSEHIHDDQSVRVDCSRSNGKGLTTPPSIKTRSCVSPVEILRGLRLRRLSQATVLTCGCRSCCSNRNCSLAYERELPVPRTAWVSVR